MMPKNPGKEQEYVSRTNQDLDPFLCLHHPIIVPSCGALFAVLATWDSLFCPSPLRLSKCLFISQVSVNRNLTSTRKPALTVPISCTIHTACHLVLEPPVYLFT